MGAVFLSQLVCYSCKPANTHFTSTVGCAVRGAFRPSQRWDQLAVAQEGGRVPRGEEFSITEPAAACRPVFRRQGGRRHPPSAAKRRLCRLVSEQALEKGHAGQVPMHHQPWALQRCVYTWLRNTITRLHSDMMAGK